MGEADLDPPAADKGPHSRHGRDSESHPGTPMNTPAPARAAAAEAPLNERNVIAATRNLGISAPLAGGFGLTP